MGLVANRYDSRESAVLGADKRQGKSKEKTPARSDSGEGFGSGIDR